MLGTKRDHSTEHDVPLQRRLKLATFGVCCNMASSRARMPVLTAIVLPGVFHSMLERDSSARTTLFGQTWRIMLLCIDAIQVCEDTRPHVFLQARTHPRLQITVLALNPEFGWSPALVQWMDTFSMLDLLLPQRDPGAWVRNHNAARFVGDTDEVSAQRGSTSSLF